MKTPHLSFAKGTKYLLDGKEFESDGIDVETGKVRVVRRHTKEAQTFTTAELAHMRMEGQLTLPADNDLRHVPTGRPTLRPLTAEQRRRVQRRQAYSTACAPLYPVGPLSNRLKTAIDEVAERIGDKLPPSPHSVYRWVRRYVLSNYDTAVFVQDAGALRQRKPRLGKGVHDLLALEIERLLGSNPAATLSGVMDEALASVAKQLGYLTFTAKDGTQYMPDEFLLVEQQRRMQATQEQPNSEAA